MAIDYVIGITVQGDYGNHVGGSGYWGCIIQIGPSNVEITELGRFVGPGSGQEHTLLIRNEDGDILGQTVVDTTGAPSGEFLYGEIESPLTLLAGQTYTLTSEEFEGGDNYYGFLTIPVLETTDDISLVGVIEGNESSPVADSCFVPLSMRYNVSEETGTDNPYSYTDECGRLSSCTEAITHLASAGSDESFRTLIAATRTAIYSSNDRTGNWRILADGLGGGYDEELCDTCSSRRFRSTQLGNYVLFTNNFDPVLAWKYGDPPSGLNLWSAHNVEDLLVVGITKARAITTFNGFVIIGNVDIEGQHKSSSIYWSDYNAPLSWVPHDQSLAGFHEFGIGDKILRIEGLGKYLMVYTDKAVYQGVYVGGDLVFNFQRIPTDSPLAYEHSLVNIGNAHVYGSYNGLYVVTASDPRPSRYEWVHKADAAIYTGISANILGGFVGLDPFGPLNKDQCDQFVGGYNQLTEEIWFSWPTDDNTCPNMSLVLNLRYNAADLVDHGFTAFTNYKPDYRPSIRDWLDSEGVCPTVVSDFVKEGLPLDTDPNLTPTYLWNEDEDPTLPIHPNSWCARLNGTTVDDLCETCESDPVFLMADASDFTIKEADPETFYREQYSNGTYTQTGYYSLLQSDMSKIGSDEEKIIKQIVADFQAEEQEPPSDIYCEVGNGAQPRCSFWHSAEPVELRCLTDRNLAEHDSANTRPDPSAKFPFWRRGQFLGYRLYVAGVGGAHCMSRVELTLSKAQARTH